MPDNSAQHVRADVAELRFLINNQCAERQDFYVSCLNWPADNLPDIFLSLPLSARDLSTSRGYKSWSDNDSTKR